MTIPRIVLIINIVLLAFLGYIVVGFIYSDSGEQDVVSEPVSTTGGEENIPSKNTVSADNPGIIVERNIFGSSEPNLVKQKPVEKPKENPVVVVKPQLRLIATVAGDEDVACAVIENLKTKVQDLYRIGDVIEGAKIERIDRNKIILLSKGKREVLNLYVAGRTSEKVETVPEPVVAQETDASDIVKVISPTEREIDRRAFLARVGGMEAILKKVKVDPYLENGKEEGVRISGLEDFSMARFVGFRNGDIIQNINGVTVTNRRKAFQILRKVRSQSSIKIQLLRDKEQKKLSFGMK